MSRGIDYRPCRTCGELALVDVCDVCAADALMRRMLSVRIEPRKGTGFEARRLTRRVKT